MTLDTLLCGHCGMPLEVRPGAASTVCRRCGTRLSLGRTAAPAPPRRKKKEDTEPARLGSVRRRMEVMFVVFLLGVGVLALRLIYLQWVAGRGFAELADRMQERTLPIRANRGRIRDRNGAEMAVDLPHKALAINPRVLPNPEATADRIGELLSLPKEQTEKMAARLVRAADHKSAYSQLVRGVDRKVALAAIQESRKDENLQGLTLEESPVRVNPSGADGIQLLGTVGRDGHGIEGLEMFLNPVLGGHEGKRRVRVSADGQPIPESEERLDEPQDGRDVRLGLDRDIQHFVEAELKKVAEEQTPDAATAIVMDVHTGDVLGMANYPSFAPGQKQITPEQRRNRAITDLFEPGSIFKVITAAAALENGVKCSFYCNGSRAIGKRTIHCAHGERHGAVDMNRMIEQSCNIAAGGLAERIGAQKMYAFLDKMGFQAKTGVEYPGEETGHIPKPETWALSKTITTGFGQGVVTTPIQLLSAYCAIANDGLYMPPRLVLEGASSKQPPRKPHRVMSPENARKLRTYMQSVVEKGTGKAAKVAGYTVAGKTGTAQIAKHGSYNGNGYVASFAGFIPAAKPKLAILVSVWHPRKGQYGGTVSAPAFREIARESAAFLRIPPDVPEDTRDGAHPGAGTAVAHASHND